VARCADRDGVRRAEAGPLRALLEPHVVRCGRIVAHRWADDGACSKAAASLAAAGSVRGHVLVGIVRIAAATACCPCCAVLETGLVARGTDRVPVRGYPSTGTLGQRLARLYSILVQALCWSAKAKRQRGAACREEICLRVRAVILGVGGQYSTEYCTIL